MVLRITGIRAGLRRLRVPLVATAAAGWGFIVELDMALSVLPEVASALAAGRPVVALESTLICHGIPRPRNLALARALEERVRADGAVPATVAVIDGRLRVGLSDAELEWLAGCDNVAKASTADLALALASGGPAATTVASTVFAAAKSILDLPRTLEVLETRGITVVGLDTDELPAFYGRSSGLRIGRVAGVAGAAQVIRRQADLGWPSSVVIANPPPADLALSAEAVESLVTAALSAARAAGASGKAETPFVLAHMARASRGRTVELNEALVLANASAAAAIAHHATAG
jgi:pseudouridine-5'-phosphate glycosidase